MLMSRTFGTGILRVLLQAVMELGITDHRDHCTVTYCTEAACKSFVEPPGSLLATTLHYRATCIVYGVCFMCTCCVRVPSDSLLLQTALFCRVKHVHPLVPDDLNQQI